MASLTTLSHFLISLLFGLQRVNDYLQALCHSYSQL
jgi:hypothetical protein